MIELFEYRRKQVVLKDKLSILSMKVALDDDELYTEKFQTSELSPLLVLTDADCSIGDDNGTIVTITFAYSPGGNILLLKMTYC